MKNKTKIEVKLLVQNDDSVSIGDLVEACGDMPSRFSKDALLELDSITIEEIEKDEAFVSLWLSYDKRKKQK